ncbi:hypothetical protein AVEN_80322-1 [Araneus ventricosus]|uniref:Histone-lysine N-methyltransferase SETMAR n=1 Tax=Araneus ventricosus TaxID=182803 RepID=A0A4Y2MPE8_ARAVE|nr:hypothetical protein AVEN_80322-1 [Araneus ventricosus]
MVLCVNGAETLKTGESTFMMERDKDSNQSQQKILFNEFPQLLERFKWDVSDHPPCSPDLATSDFHLFRELKNWLGGQSIQKKED